MFHKCISQICGDNDYVHMNISISLGKEWPGPNGTDVKGLKRNGSCSGWLEKWSAPCLILLEVVPWSGWRLESEHTAFAHWCWKVCASGLNIVGRRLFPHLDETIKLSRGFFLWFHCPWHNELMKKKTQHNNLSMSRQYLKTQRLLSFSYHTFLSATVLFTALRIITHLIISMRILSLTLKKFQLWGN